MKTINCKICNNKFITRNITWVYCSDNCRIQAKLENVKRYQKTENGKRTTKTRNQLYRLDVFGKFGGVCNHCGFHDLRALQIDHKFGGGTAERRLIKDTYQLVRNISKGRVDINLYQLLCANCNWIKRYENNEVQQGRKVCKTK